MIINSIAFKTALTLLFVCIALSGFSQDVIPLYNGQRPAGSEMLTYPEKVQKGPGGEAVMISGVSMPTLTVYKPEAGQANGTAIIICPGGAFRFLSFESEGNEVARWLVSKGITTFILKYRLVADKPGLNSTLFQDLQRVNFARIDSVNAPFVPLAVADGLEAVRYVRQHAAEYGIDPLRIGIMGFSAGGTVTGSVAQTYDSQSRPDFAAPIYAYCPAMLGDKVPSDAPPMFLALASDDPIANANTRLYEKWRDAGKPIEMHIYGKGGHGFGIQKRGLPTDDWTKRFEDWMISQGFLKSKSTK
jgi:acetyl esterase/lipase